MKNKFAQLTILLLALAVGYISLNTGCSSTQTTTAFKTESGANLTVSGAMTGWGAYVSLNHPGTNAENTVFKAFQAYKSAEISAIDLTESLAASPTNSAATTNAVISATALQNQALTNLFNVISSFGVKF